MSDIPLDEFGNIPKDYLQLGRYGAGNQLKSIKNGGRYPKGDGPEYLWRKLKRDDPAWVSRDVIDEANREYRERIGPGHEWNGAYNTPGKMQQKADRLVASMTKDNPRVKNIPDVRLMTDEELAAYAEAILNVDKYDWELNARAEQLEPDDYYIWLIAAGRGFGKTRAASETIRKWCKTPGTRVAIVALGHRELRDINLDGVSGLLNVFPADEIATVKKGLGDVSITLTNGSIITGLTAGNPEAVRGRSFDAVVLDEYAAYPPGTAQDVLDQLTFCLRESSIGESGRIVITTTPRRVKHIISLFERAKTDPTVVITTGKTRDNTHLSDAALRQMEAVHGGTRLGRQEMDGELLLDVEGALWTEGLLEYARLRPGQGIPDLIGCVVGVDPSGSEGGDECGIVVVGWDSARCLYVIANKTTGGPPGERYKAACIAAYDHRAKEIVWESAYGGDNIKMALESAWKDLVHEKRIPAEYRMPPLYQSTMKGNKVARAEPLVQRYEVHRGAIESERPPAIWHVEPNEYNGIAKLETELTTWEPHSNKSPNALDALVHAGRRVMVMLGLEVGVAKASNNRRIDLGWRP